MSVKELQVLLVLPQVFAILGQLRPFLMIHLVIGQCRLVELEVSVAASTNDVCRRGHKVLDSLRLGLRIVSLLICTEETPTFLGRHSFNIIIDWETSSSNRGNNLIIHLVCGVGHVGAHAIA